MKTILYVEASPRQERSTSSAMGAYFLDRVSQSAGPVRTETLPLWRTSLPDLSATMLDAKYARLAGRELTSDQAANWTLLEALVAQLDAADAVVLSTPMWNFGIPYRLKHWIDLVTQPGLTFRFTPGVGYVPLLRPRPTLAIMSSAGDYAFGPSYSRPDLASGYLYAALGFIGLKDARIVPVGPTVGPAEAVERGRHLAEDRLKVIATTFLKAAP